MTRYTRRDAIRILHLLPRQLAAWERAGLIESFAGEEAHYSFTHLRRLAALRDMQTSRVSARQMRAGEEAMERLLGVDNALVATVPVTEGRALRFRHGGALVDPSTQQLRFDFDRHSGAWANGELKVVNAPAPSLSRALDRDRASSLVSEMFLRGVRLEERPATLAEAQQTYEALLELDPRHAPACINLGTILYNQRKFAEAEALYRRATEADPHYALAFFDLGNVLDERQELEPAIAAYERAIDLVPGYADAHYNLALALERRGETRRALRHWTAYARLDPDGPWSAHARGQTRKILATERLRIVSRGGVPAQVAAS